MTMRTLATMVWVLCLQYVVGAALVGGVAVLRTRHGVARGSRRTRVKWSRAARSLLRAAPLPLGVALLGGLLRPGAADSGWPAGLALSGSMAAAGCYLLQTASGLERRGRLRAARHQARLGGDLTSLGVLLPILWLAVASGGEPGPPHTALLGTALLVAVAPIALLAGFSGKPRPGGRIAGLAYLVGLTLLVAP